MYIPIRRIILAGHRCRMLPDLGGDHVRVVLGLASQCDHMLRNLDMRAL